MSCRCFGVLLYMVELYRSRGLRIGVHARVAVAKNSGQRNTKSVMVVAKHKNKYKSNQSQLNKISFGAGKTCIGKRQTFLSLVAPTQNGFVISPVRKTYIGQPKQQSRQSISPDKNIFNQNDARLYVLYMHECTCAAATCAATGDRCFEM